MAAEIGDPDSVCGSFSQADRPVNTDPRVPEGVAEYRIRRPHVEGSCGSVIGGRSAGIGCGWEEETGIRDSRPGAQDVVCNARGPCIDVVPYVPEGDDRIGVRRTG